MTQFISSSYATEGPVHHPDYYAEIISYVLANKDLSQYHQARAEEALPYLENSKVSSSIKANLVKTILLKRELEELHMQVAATAVVLITERDFPIKAKAFIALQLFTNTSLGEYYEHEAAIRTWKEFSSDKSTHSSVSLAKEVIACKILNNPEFKAHHKHAISVWKNLEISAKAFTACDILQDDSLLRHHKYAENALKEFFFSEDEIVPWYTKARLSKIIRKTRAKKLKNAREIAVAYFNSLEDEATTSEDKSPSVSISEERQIKRTKNPDFIASAQEKEQRKKRRKSTINPDSVY